MTRSLVCLSLTLCFLILMQDRTQGDVVYSTNFNSPLYTDGGLIGQDGWLITGTSTVNPVAVSNTATDGLVSLTTTGQDVNRPFDPQPVSTLVSMNLTFELNVTAAQTAGDYFIHLSDGGTSNFWSRIYARSSTTPGFFQMAMGTSSGATVNYGADLPLGTLLTISARYDVIAGTGNDTGELFVNGNSYIAATTIGIDPTTSFSALNLRQGTAASAPTVVVDNISVSATAIPEPSSLIVLALGLAGALTRRRK